MITLLLISVLLICVLIALRVPMSICFAGAVLFMALFSPDIQIDSLILQGFYQVLNPTLLAVPLFIFGGGVLAGSGVAERLLNLVSLFVGRIRGGLGIVAVVTCGIIGAISGSGFTGVASIGPVFIPHMVKKGYSRGYATALCACSSILGIIIPPSGVMIIFGWVTDTSILACFLSLLGPGLVLIVVFCIINVVMARRMPALVLEQPLNAGDRAKLFVNRSINAIPALLAPVIILGGIYGGIFTPTEAAAIGAVYCVPVGLFIYHTLTWKSLGTNIVNAATAVGTIMVLIFSSLMLAQIYTMLQIPQLILNLMLGITTSKVLLLFIVFVFYFFVGMIMSDVPATIITAPLLMPLMKQIGIDPVHFAAILGTNLAMGGLTPPYASILYLGMRIGKVSFAEIVKPTTIFVLLGCVPVCLLTTYWPDLSLFFPRIFGYLR